MVQQVTENTLSQYFEEIYRSAKSRLTDDPAPLAEAREQAFRLFQEKGIPPRKNELYKYTDLDPVFRFPYRMAHDIGKPNLSPGELFQCDVPEIQSHLVLLVNGQYHAHLNTLDKLRQQIDIGSLAEIARQQPEMVSRYFSTQVSQSPDGLAALTGMFSHDGIFIRIPDRVVVDQPIQIVNLVASDEALMVHHRNLFILGKQAQATIIVCEHTLSDHHFLTNSATEFFAGEGSKLNYSRIQNQNNKSRQFTHLLFSQQKDSEITSNTITLHGGLIRNNINVNLNEPGAVHNAYGLFITDDHQHVDNYLNIQHNAPDCQSNQLIKGILDDASTGAFNGRIFVKQDAQKTLAYQKNNNLLLSDTARMNTKPQLEIYADDVKCSHGATVGQLNEDAMFYMQARGIGRKEARLLLMHAFAHEVLSKIESPALRDRIDEQVNRRLRGELSHCHNCSLNCC